MPYMLIAICSAVLIVFVLLISILRRFKRCPSDKILVIYGKVAKGQTARCIHGGASFIWPIIQDFSMLDLTPIQVNIPLDNALSKQNIRVAVPAMFTIGISTKSEVMALAAERLLGLNTNSIKEMASEIIIGQMRLVVAQMDIEEINSNRDKFLEGIYKNVETELEKVGLRLINVNIQDIRDASGYLDALGKNAAAEAINRAKKDVAEKTRDGEIGQANAQKDQVVQVATAKATAESGQADAERMKRVNVAAANATAVEGENTAQITIANSTSNMRQKKAEADRQAVAAEKVAAARAFKEAYEAEQIAETARAERERATKTADEVVKIEIERKKIEIAAEAAKTKAIKEAEGEGEAIYAKLNGQARGILEILNKQAEGLKNVVAAAGGDPKQAATLLIIDKLPELVKTQVDAIKNIKIDKITVWDSGANEGTTSTANFMANLFKAVPPLSDLFNQAGLSLPEILATKNPPETKKLP